MDDFLEDNDLGPLMEKYGVMRKSSFKNVDLSFPEDLVSQMNKVANRLGVPRDAMLQIWIYERLKQEIPQDNK